LLKGNLSECEEYLQKLYRESVTKLQIFLFNPNGNDSIFQQVENNLRNFCDYNVISSNPSKNHFSDNILNSDFVLFLSVYDSGILDDVQYLKTYSRPGLALGAANFNMEHKMQVLSNGTQLAKNGINVINKMYSPVRLYTTIDKLYLKYYLCRQTNLN